MPSTSKSVPTNNFNAIPTPPSTFNAPVVLLDESVVSLISNVPVMSTSSLRVITDVVCPIEIGTAEVAVPIVIPFEVFELSIFNVDVESKEISEPSTTKVPSISVLSKLVVPSTSKSSAIVTLPSAMSKAVCAFVPVIVSFSAEESQVKLSPAVSE